MRLGQSGVTGTHLNRIGSVRLALVVVGLGFIGLVVVLKLVEITGSTTPFVFALLVLALATAVRIVFSSRPDAPQTVFALLLALTAFCIVIGVDIYRIEGDIDRMNTVFKFYLQVWVLLALASAYMLWLLWHGRSGSLDSLPKGKKVWLGCLGVLLVCVSVYPVLGTHDRLGVRFDTTVPLTLDGMAYMRDGQEYSDRRGTIDLSADYEAIRWIQQNVEGSPVMLEGGDAFLSLGRANLHLHRPAKYRGLGMAPETAEVELPRDRRPAHPAGRPDLQHAVRTRGARYHAQVRRRVRLPRQGRASLL